MPAKSSGKQVSSMTGGKGLQKSKGGGVKPIHGGSKGGARSGTTSRVPDGTKPSGSGAGGSGTNQAC